MDGLLEELKKLRIEGQKQYYLEHNSQTEDTFLKMVEKSTHRIL